MNFGNITSDEKCTVKCPKHLLNKMHIKQKPNCHFLFTKCKVGESIWKQANVFTISDPLMRDTSNEYNPLYDPHLKPFFARKVHLNHLRKNDIITSRNEVICSVKEFNDYRKYLHRVGTEEKRAEKRDENVRDLNCHRIKISGFVYDKIFEKNRKFREKYSMNGGDRCASANPVKYESMLETMKRRKLEQECQRKEKFMLDIIKYTRRMDEIQQLKHLQQTKLKERADRRNMEIQKKKMFVEEKHRKKQIEMKKIIAARDKAMRKKIAGKFNSQMKKVNVIVKCPIEM